MTFLEILYCLRPVFFELSTPVVLKHFRRVPPNTLLRGTMR